MTLKVFFGSDLSKFLCHYKCTLLSDFFYNRLLRLCNFINLHESIHICAVERCIVTIEFKINEKIFDKYLLYYLNSIEYWWWFFFRGKFRGTWTDKKNVRVIWTILFHTLSLINDKAVSMAAKYDRLKLGLYIQCIWMMSARWLKLLLE